MQGVIIEIGSNLYKAINRENGKIYELIPRGKLKKEEITPVVGDMVEFNNQGSIESVLPRKVYIKRPKLANITQMILVVSSKDPKPDLLLLDKQIAFAEFLNVKVVIVLNKIDLDKKQQMQKIKEIYENIGYKVIETQAKEKFIQSITNLIPVSRVNKRRHAKNSNPLDGKIRNNLTLWIHTKPKFNYLYFPQNAEGTSKGKIPNDFMERGIDAEYDNVVNGILETEYRNYANFAFI